jgi:hypothetical protein
MYIMPNQNFHWRNFVFEFLLIIHLITTERCWKIVCKLLSPGDNSVFSFLYLYFLTILINIFKTRGLQNGIVLLFDRWDISVVWTYFRVFLLYWHMLEVFLLYWHMLGVFLLYWHMFEVFLLFGHMLGVFLLYGHMLEVFLCRDMCWRYFYCMDMF